MQAFAAILMVKNAETGVMERELCSVAINKHGELLRNIYATEENGVVVVRMFMTTDKDVQDWEFQAIYDAYDIEVFAGLELDVSEAPGDDNPVWQIAFPYGGDAERLSIKLEGILNLHQRELDGVYEAIEGLEGEYNDV